LLIFFEVWSIIEEVLSLDSTEGIVRKGGERGWNTCASNAVVSSRVTKSADPRIVVSHARISFHQMTNKEKVMDTVDAEKLI
jgi:hypothetical protein